MTARDTSIKTYEEITNEGLVGERQLIVLKAFKEVGTASDMMIADHLRYTDPNKVRPRRFELVEMGIVEEVKVDIDPITSRNVIFWRIKDIINFKPLQKDEYVLCDACQGTGKIKKVPVR